MKTLLIKNIAGQTSVLLKFGYGFLRLLSEKWDVNGPVAILKHFGEKTTVLLQLFADAGINDPQNLAQLQKAGASIDLPFEAVDALVDIIACAGKYQNPDFNISDDEIAEYIFEHPAIMAQIIALFMESMPRQKEAGPGNEPAPIPTVTQAQDPEETPQA